MSRTLELVKETAVELLLQALEPQEPEEPQEEDPGLTPEDFQRLLLQTFEPVVAAIREQTGLKGVLAILIKFSDEEVDVGEFLRVIVLKRIAEETKQEDHGKKT